MTHTAAVSVNNAALTNIQHQISHVPETVGSHGDKVHTKMCDLWLRMIRQVTHEALSGN